MPMITVPAGAAPRLLTKVQGTVALCQLSPDGDAGCPPAGYVNVSILPWGTKVDGEGAAVTPDAAGQFLHCLFSFSVPPIDAGKRRATELNSPLPSLPPTVAARTQLDVETDAGRYWIGSPCALGYVGGTPGDIYSVCVQFSCVKQVRDQCQNVDLMEPAFEFGLTSWFFTENGAFVQFPGSGILLPQYHTHFEATQGAARVVLAAGNVPLNASYGPSGRVPLTNRSTSAGIQVSTGIYRTTGAF